MDHITHIFQRPHPTTADLTPPAAAVKTAPPRTVAAALVSALEDLGIHSAFGVSGGAIAPLWAALTYSTIPVVHFRHEAGAAFAAIETYFASGRPAVVFATTGPGITNAFTGLFAARYEGAKLLLLSPSTPAPNRGRWAFQETSAFTMPAPGLFAPGIPCHYAAVVEHEAELPEVVRRLAAGFARPGGFVAHLSLPLAVQSSPTATRTPRVYTTVAAAPRPAAAELDECVRRLAEGRFAIWAGFGARGAAKQLRRLAERTGAGVMCSPRAKGVFPEEHPQFVGVTGFAGHRSVFAYMREEQPTHTLVLGTRLGEFTSFWSPALVPPGGFIHVDVDPDVPSAAYPSVETLPIQADVGAFLEALLERLPEAPTRARRWQRPERLVHGPVCPGRVRPEVLLEALQSRVVDGSDAVVLTEAGNSFSWGTHALRFAEPGRWRVSVGFGSMGQASTGVLGAAIGAGTKAVALLGDGAMLMNNELSTAVAHQNPAVWVVLNDARYNMCEQGNATVGIEGLDTAIPAADFVAIARAVGAHGVRVEREEDLAAALDAAMAATGPFVVDVLIDPSAKPPAGGRFQSLIDQGSK